MCPLVISARYRRCYATEPCMPVHSSQPAAPSADALACRYGELRNHQSQGRNPHLRRCLLAREQGR